MKKTLIALGSALVAVCAAPVWAQDIVDPKEPNVAISHDKFPDLIDKAIADQDFIKARRIVEEGLKRNPLSVQMLFQRAVIYEGLGETARAQAAFEAFVARYPEIAEPYNNLAVIYSSQGELEKAHDMLSRALSIRPDFAVAWANMGNLYLVRAKQAYQNAKRYGAASVEPKLDAVNRLLKQ